MKAIIRNRLEKMVVLIVSIFIVTACIEKEQTIGMKDEQIVSENAGSVSIARIIQNSESLKDTKVTVSGIVSAGKAFQFVNEQPYLIKDDTGEIWVITSGSVPKDGSKISVTGKVAIPFQIKGRRYDIAILETERK
jgi:hypothetical protein